jgi:truncated hemoglobin YjbI
VQVRQVVETFLVLVGKDEDLRRVFTTDDLSDEQQIQFKDKVRLIERELGVTWGTEPEKTPQGQAKLSNRMLASGLMI